MKTFTVIDCYGTVYNHDEDSWDYNVSVTDFTVDISIKDTSDIILAKLCDVGFFAEQITTEDAYAEWLDVDLIVINAVDTHEPICRLEIR